MRLGGRTERKEHAYWGVVLVPNSTVTADGDARRGDVMVVVVVLVRAILAVTRTVRCSAGGPEDFLITEKQQVRSYVRLFRKRDLDMSSGAS